MTSATMFDTDGLRVRLAKADDEETLTCLVDRSFRELGSRDYPAATVAAAAGSVIRFESLLLQRGRVFVVEDRGEAVACAGWGGYYDWLAPHVSPAEGSRIAVIRSVFVSPGHAGRGLGRRLMELCHADAEAAGRQDAWLMATLTGVQLYLRLGYEVVEVCDLPLEVDGSIRGLVMRRPLRPAAQARRCIAA